jgi:murein DD-endopeptidase MepM/ murein hydrolase activator NlpD
MKKIFFFIAPLLILIPISLRIFSTDSEVASLAPSATQDGDIETEIKAQVESAITQAIDSTISAQKESSLALLIYDTAIYNIQVSSDQQWATAWLVPVDRESGRVVPTEPGLTVVKWENGEWQAVLPSDPLWSQAVAITPNELLSVDEKTTWLEREHTAREETSELGPYGGYLLPWEGGKSLYLTQSTGHDQYTPNGSAHYAFDFATTYPSSLFNLHAAKAGTVKQAVWHYTNGNESFGNYIVLEDTSTIPTTYQLYLHLAKESIPAELRVIGTPVAQGQFIGVADDTGISTGNHLHFHVHTEPASYWGRSVDITFNDVSINGGRPRIPSDLHYCWETDECSQTQYNYTSENFGYLDKEAPTGGIFEPSHGITLESNSLYLEGWALDSDSGLSRAQFVAKYNGAWNNIGEIFTTNIFSMDWDLCSDQVPDGPVAVALEIKDNSYNRGENLPGLIHFTKNYTCPEPAPLCEPNEDEIGLYAEPNFSGECVRLSEGEYTAESDFGNLGVDNAASIKVGANVQATLYIGNDLTGRGETFFENNSNLSDNRIGANTASSIMIRPLNTLPSAPNHIWPENNAQYDEDGSLSLVWEDSGGAAEFQVRILVDGMPVYGSTWQRETTWHLNNLDAGIYTWQVIARNNSGQSGWSEERTLEIQNNSGDPSTPLPTPYSDTMEDLPSTWTHSNYWDLTGDENHSPGGTISWMYDVNSGIGYDSGTPNSGYLTSPPIEIPVYGNYFLRFWYKYETESKGLLWDQRLIQVSADGGPFITIAQLSDDVSNIWLESPAIPLSVYSGSTIQVRFYFATLDKNFNDYQGWYIDDFSITPDAPPDCGDTNDDFQNATPISYGEVVNGLICPSGDIDYYQFEGTAGEQVGIAVDTSIIGSSLDPYLYLLDSDGSSVIIENDDQIPFQRRDSFVSFRLPHDGTYFIKIRAWDHPAVGGFEYPYNLRLVHDESDPAAAFAQPLDEQYILPGVLDLIVSADDTISGIKHIEFFRHSEDWVNSDWEKIGEDWDGTDGWRIPYTIPESPVPPGIAFYAVIHDWAGNWLGTGVWNLKPYQEFFPLVNAGP